MMHKTASGSPASTVPPVIGQHMAVADSAWPTEADSLATRALATDPRMVVLHGTLLSLVRRDGRDLTARQLTAFLSVYRDEHTHTVGSLGELLRVSRPAVTRIMDRLLRFGLAAREEDREDRRRILARRTTRGAAFFGEMVGICRAVDVLPTGEAAEHLASDRLAVGVPG